MVLFNYSTKELTAKIVYYGPGLCGKTTNLQYIHENLSKNVKGKMLSLATKTDRTLFFDFLPMDLGEIRGMKTRMQLYTVPGQVFYNETRKLVLKGVDGIVFVADSQATMLEPNVESFKNLEENLKTHGLSLAEIPHVIQLNKRDLPKLSPIEDLNSALNKYNAPFYESVATTGIGVQDSLKAITKLVLLNLTSKYEPRATSATAAKPAASAPRPVAEPAPQPAPMAAAPAEQPQSIPLSEPAAPPMAGAVAATPQPPADDAPPPVLSPEMLEQVARNSEPETDADPLFEAPASAEAEVAGPSFDSDEIDEFMDEAGTPSDPSPDAAEPTVRLTEVAEDSDLFTDPNLQVARMNPGEAREIVIPVEVGQGDATRRFKLALRLCLDPVD